MMYLYVSRYLYHNTLKYNVNTHKYSNDKPPKGRAPHSQITHHTKRRTYRTPDLYNVHMFYS